MQLHHNNVSDDRISAEIEYINSSTGNIRVEFDYIQVTDDHIEVKFHSIHLEIEKYVGWLETGEWPEAQVALIQLNKLIGRTEEELKTAKSEIRRTHDTNEFIITSLHRAIVGDDNFIKYVMAKPQLQSTNILHEPGWLYELAFASYLEKQGKVGFLTFGTMFDPEGFDIVSLSHPEAKIEWPNGFPPPL